MRFGVPMKGKRELEENGTEFVGGAENVEAGADEFFVFEGNFGERAGGSVRGFSERSLSCSGGAFGFRERFVGELLPQLGGEDEAGVSGNAVEPLRCEIGAKRAVEGGIDLDSVEELREVGRFVKAFWTRRGINVPGPVGVRPTGGADAEMSSGEVERHQRRINTESTEIGAQSSRRRESRTQRQSSCWDLRSRRFDRPRF